LCGGIEKYMWLNNPREARWRNKRQGKEIGLNSIIMIEYQELLQRELI
jgi:hypothetical protein